MRFRADVTGKVGIYEPGPGGTDDVFDDPLIDLGRIIFHTQFPFLGIANVITGSVTAVAFQPFPADIVLGAHGMAGVPAFMGVFLNYPTGKITPWGGTVPLWQDTTTTRSGISCWGTLSADATNIYASFRSFSNANFTRQWAVYIFDELME